MSSIFPRLDMRLFTGWNLVLALGIPFFTEAQVLPDCSGGSGPVIKVANFSQGEAIGYPLLLIKGSVETAVTQVTVNLGGTVRTWPAAAGNFKAFVPLKPGANTIGLSAPGQKNACLEIKYSPRKFGPRVQVLYILGKEVSEGPGMFPNLPGQASDFASAKKRIGLAMSLAQTGYAELLHEAGKPRLAFNPVRDANGDVDVKIWRSNLTTDELQAAKAQGKDVRNFMDEIRASYPDHDLKLMLFIQPIDIWPVSIGELSWTSGLLLYSFAETLDDFVERLNDTRSSSLLGFKVDGTGNTFHRSTFYDDYAASIGAVMHELGHNFGLYHSGNPNDVMQSGLYNIGDLFSIRVGGQLVQSERVEWGEISRNFLLQSPFILGPLQFQPSLAVAATLPGLQYKYYEGDWLALPDFSALTPVTENVSPRFQLGMEKRVDGFGLSFSGYLDVPTTGEYGFTLKADDGFRFSIGDSVLVSKTTRSDSLPGIDTSPRTVSIGLDVGRHAVRLDYFESVGKKVLEVLWQGEGFARMPLPDTVLSYQKTTTSLSSAKGAGSKSYMNLDGRSVSLYLPQAEMVSFSFYSPSGALLQTLYHGLLPAGESRFPIPKAFGRGTVAIIKSMGKIRTFAL